MKFIHYINNLFASIEKILVIIILSAMIIIAFLQVILRNFFSTSLFWGDAILRHLVLWIGFLGASLATVEQKHINIDVLSKILNAKAKMWSQIIVNLFAAVICFFLMNAAITFIKLEYENNSIIFSGFPAWIAEIIIVIGFGTMMLRFFFHSLEYVVIQFRPSPGSQS